MATKAELKAILKRLEGLDLNYWKRRFEVHDKRRLKKNRDTESIILFLLDECLEDIYEFIYSFYGRYAEGGIVPSEVASLRMNSTELASLLKYLNGLIEQAGGEGIEFDRDLLDDIELLGQMDSPTRIEGLIIKIRSRIEYAYGTIENRLVNHFKETVDDAYYTSVYEIFSATGYGTKDMDYVKVSEQDNLEEAIPLILLLSWRSSNEAFDDVVWRQKRMLQEEAQKEVKQASYLKRPAVELLENTSSLFRRENNSLKRLVQTDSTFYSTESQVNAFYDTNVEECLYCTIDDERRTEICAEADGNIIPVDDIEPWVNAPPLHYNCRSWLTPIIKDVGFLDGDTYEMEGMDFDTWYDTWV